jgi:hypothetical protein
MAKKLSKHLVFVGTSIPTTTKLALQDMADSQGKSIYEVLQEVVIDLVAKHEKELAKMKTKKTAPVIEDDSDLLA